MLETWEMIAFISYGIPSIILYIFVLNQLLFKPAFKSSFFRLAAIMGFVDLSNHLAIWLYMKLILWPGTAKLYLAIQNYPIIFEILLFFIYYFTKARELLLLSTTLNRFTAIKYPYKQQAIWNKYLIPIVIFCLTFPICLTFHIFTGTGVILPFLKDSNESFVMDVRDSVIHVDNALINAIHTSTVSLLSLIINITTLFTLYTKIRSVSNQSNIPNKSEINLLAISCIDFGLDCLAVAQQLYSYSFTFRGIYYHPVFDFLYLLYPWIYDLINLSRPYLLIIMCTQMRIAFLTFVNTKIITAQISISSGTTFSGLNS